MTVSEIFSVDCRGTVFDLPCPKSFVAGEGHVFLSYNICHIREVSRKKKRSESVLFVSADRSSCV